MAPRKVVFVTSATGICSLGHGLRTLTAMPRSTRPSIFHGTGKWVSAFGLSNNNKWRWWMRIIAAFTGGLIVQVGWLVMRVGGHPTLSPHSSNEPGEHSQRLRRNDSTINIIVVLLQRAQCSHCKRCIGYGNSVRLSVCLSVCLSHAGIVSKRRHVARCSFHRWIAKCV